MTTSTRVSSIQIYYSESAPVSRPAPCTTPENTDADGDGIGTVWICDEDVQTGEQSNPVNYGDPDDSDPNNPIPPVASQICADAAGTTQDAPTGNTRQVDADGDGVPVVEYQTQTFILTAECALVPGPTQWVSTGAPDPDDDDDQVPPPPPSGGACTALNGTTTDRPTGQREDRDEDGDEVPRIWVQWQTYTINADCSQTATGAPYWQDTGGPDPDDFNDQNPVPTVNAPSLDGFALDDAILSLSVSHAQCRDDAVSFTIETAAIEDPAFDVNLTILDDDGDVVVTIPRSGLIPTSPNALHQYAAAFNPGTYAALATAVVPTNPIQVLSVFDSAAFNVPVWGCQGFTPADRADIRADILDILDDLNFTSVELQAHRENSMEVLGMTFDGLTFEELLVAALWVAVLWWSLRNGYVMPAIVATLMVPAVWVEQLPSQTFGFVALALFLWLEALGTRSVFKRWVTGKEKI